MDQAHEAGAAARGLASDVDDRILAIWRALRTNPSLDTGWAMQVIDRLLDQRPRPAQVPPPGPPAATVRDLGPGSPAQQAILASLLREFLTEDPG
jgi:hypothetical protein